MIALALLVAAWCGRGWEQREEVRFLASGHRPNGQMVSVGIDDLHVVTAGQGPPGVLFLSGLGDSHSSWRDLQRRVSQLTVTVSYDRRGLGWSPPGNVEVTLDTAADDVLSLITRSGIFDHPPILVGHSLGGALARHVAYRYPKAISALVLVDATPMDVVLPTMDRLMELWANWQVATASLGINRRRLYSRNAGAPADSRLLWGQLYASERQARAARRELLGFSPALAEPPRTHGLGTLPLTVIVAPTPGPPFMTEAIERIGQAKARMASESSEGHLVEAQTGHYVHRDEPELVFDEIAALISSLRDPAPLPPSTSPEDGRDASSSERAVSHRANEDR